MLQSFREKHFAEQFQVLQTIENALATKYIPELIGLLKDPLGDEVMDSMVQEALKKLLTKDEEATAEGLKSNIFDLRRLCVQVAGDCGFPKAGVELIALAFERIEPFFEILTACSKYHSDQMLPVFQKYLSDEDPLISTLCIESLGDLKDDSSLPFFMSAIDRCQSDNASSSDELIAAESIKAMSQMGMDECLLYLAKIVHHPHPTLRRLAHDGLVKNQSLSIPFLEDRFKQGSYDERIMVVNLLGNIGNNEAGEALSRCKDSGVELHPFVRHAMYEAFGVVQTREGVQYLLQGLEAEDDILLLLSVVHSLDSQVNPGVLMHIRKLLTKDPQRYRILIEAIVTARAVQLFKMLYKDRNLQPLLLDDLEKVGDPFLMAQFMERIPAIPKERFQSYIDAKKERCFLVVDDSPSLLRYLRAILTDDRTEVLSAGNGQEALSVLEHGKTVHLIVTDMNMPKMNGVELTRKLKKHLIFNQLPIIMVTTESETEQKLFARRAGVDAFLTKPFQPADLQEKIESILAS